MFIVTAAEQVGVDEEIIREFLYHTKSLEHRMERFWQWKNVLFVNDSKGTNLDSTSFAIDAYKDAILICGGKDKGLPLGDLIKQINSNIKAVYLIGQMSERFREELLLGGYPNERIFPLVTMENVVKALREKLSGDEKEVVLLSPTTESYDQFPNFEVRGETFKQLVKKYFEEGEEL